jgi:hypothetical protein
VRDALAEDFDGTLASSHRSVHPGRAVRSAQLRTNCAWPDRNGLTAPTAHVHLLGGRSGCDLWLAAELGVQTIIEPYVDPARWESEADISEIATELNAAAERAAASGLKVGYHNHHFELESKISGVHALEVLCGSACSQRWCWKWTPMGATRAAPTCQPC